MEHWTTIKSFAELRAFQIAFRAMSELEQAQILAEMVLVVEEYKAKIEVLEREPRQVEKSTLLRRVPRIPRRR